VYVIGGLTADSGPALTVNIYDPAKNAWTTGPDIPGRQRNGFTPASCVAGGRLYVSPADGKVYRLAAKGDAWEEAGELKQARVVHRLVAADGNRLVAVGGASKDGNVALTESVQPK
jgi:N-acetylneuraminic acid mutarotase